MQELLGSKTKARILLYLGLRGGTTGRRLARVLKISPSQVFKALQQLTRGKIVAHHGANSFYYLNPHYPHYEDLLRMIHRQARLEKNTVALFLPKIRYDRRVDPTAVYEMIAARGSKTNSEKFSDILRKRYA